MNEAKEEARGLLQEACGGEVKPDEIQVSQVADLSSTLAFKLAKKLKKSPKDVAEGLARKIKPVGLIERVEAVNGYVNFHLNFENFAKHVFNTILLSEGDYGKPLVEPEGKIVLEHTSVNPSGPIHVGRLRNSIIGDSIKRILNFAGYEVETHYFVNDIGKQMAVIALGFKEGVKPDERVLSKYCRFKDKPDFKIFFEYVAANKVFESDEKFQKRVQEMIQRAESGDKKALSAMTSAAENCLKGQKQVFDLLGIKFDVFDFESKFVVNKKALEVVSKLEKSRLWKKTEVGSGLDLSGYGIEKQGGLTVLKRLDGTTVYSARDLAYHLEKQDCGDRLINVLGEDHKLQALELKTILEKFLGFKKPLDVVHYSFVSFEGSKLSTRKGEIASVDELLEEALEKAELEVERRGIAGKETASMIGIGAVKYHIIKTAPSKPITFSWSEALSFDGEAAPYIQYVHARSCRILEKSGEKVSGISAEKIDLNLDEIEKQLLKELSLFPDVVETSARDLKPNLIANYLYTLSSTYNKFYIQCPVLTAEKKVRDRRLLMVYSVKQVIKTGLSLIGIEAPEWM
jgi:arginyl-tRNA synthetase